MPFVKMPGFAGKIYVPETQDKKLKKHNCRDCFSCQMCCDERCELCLKGKKDCLNDINDRCVNE